MADPSRAGADGAAPEFELDGFAEWADAAPSVLWVTNQAGECVYLSRHWYETTGQAPGAGLGFGWTEMVHPEDRARVEKEFRACVEAGRSCLTEYRLRHRSGEYRWVADASGPKLDAAGRRVGFIGTVFHIADRKLAELELQRSRHELQTRLAQVEQLFEAAPVGIVLFDVTGRYERVNRSVAEMHGRTAESCVGLMPHEIGCIAADPVEHMLAEVIRTGATMLNRELRIPGAGPGGAEVVWLINFAPARDAAGRLTGVWTAVQDVSELTRLRDQVTQSQKMESIGRLAGGVAHDFNNLLTVISGYAERAVSELTPGSPGRADVEQIRLAAERAAELTRQLLAFARRQVVQPRPVDFGELLRTNEALIRRLIGEDVRLEFTGPARPAVVLLDPGQCTQILLNLAANARDAMPAGGTLSISAEIVTLTAEDIPAGETVRPGPFVRLTVADTGVGMPVHVQRRLFEPFFTTKSGGRGIGLASCYGIVKQAGGLIAVRSSTEGGGTTFTIHIPLTSERAQPGEAPAAARAAAGHEAVLLVEDEPMVREMLARVLRASGYTVAEAGTPEQALRAAGQRDFDLVIADVVLPGGSGLDVAQTVVDAKPDARVLMMSGYTGDSRAEHLPFRLIAKPFELDRFLETVRATLDAPRA